MKIIIEDGSPVRSENIAFIAIATHIEANDHLADEARALAAFCDLDDSDARPATINGIDVEYVESMPVDARRVGISQDY